MGTDEDAGLAGHDLIDDAADRAGHDGPCFPHRFGHGEPEPFGQALLHHDGRVTLQGIDDRGGFVAVGHRHARQMHPRPHGWRELFPGGVAVAQHDVRFGVISDASDFRSRKHQMRGGVGRGRIQQSPS